MTGAERQRHYRLRLASVTKAKPNADAEARIRALEAELAAARRRAAVAAGEIAKLKAAAAREGKRREAAEAKATKPPPTEAERETKAESMIKGLRTQLRHRQAELRSLVDWKNTTGVPEKGGMSRSTYGKIVKALHPDSTPSEADRAEGCRAFNAWVETLKPARWR